MIKKSAENQKEKKTTKKISNFTMRKVKLVFLTCRKFVEFCVSGIESRTRDNFHKRLPIFVCWQRRTQANNYFDRRDLLFRFKFYRFI